MSFDVETNERSRLEQGGITTAPEDISVPLVAAEYTHPTLPGRTITRLVPEPLLRAEDLSLGVTGLSPHGRTAVGHTRRRAIGFPAWPILTDPDNAQHALTLVVDLERAGRLARSSPKKAKDEIMALAAQLDNSAPHFLPTFLEEAGRMYLTTENRSYASQMFTLAREAERRHSLPVDEERHFEAVMEFAFAGAINAKELSTEAKNLSQRMKPAEAYETFRTLCVERVRGGLAPYSGMKKDLTRLAKAAGLKPAEEDARVAAEMLRAGSIEQAGAHFWKNYATAMCKAAANDESVMERLLTLTPDNVDTDFWLNLLRDAGALDRVKEGADPGFVQRIVEWEGRYTWRSTRKPSSTLAPLLAKILPHAGCKSVALHSGTLSRVPAEAIEQLVAHGIPINFVNGEGYSWIDLATWVTNDEKRDLSHLAVNEPLRPALLRGIRKALNAPVALEKLAADAHIHPLVIDFVLEHVEALEASPPTIDLLIEMTDVVKSFESVSDSEVQALLERVRSFHRDPAVTLAETLRRGLPDELGWPELDQIHADLETAGGYFNQHTARDCWPGVMVCFGKRVIHLQGTEVAEVPNWTGQDVNGAVEVDGQFAFYRYDHTNRQGILSWSGAGKEQPIESDGQYIHNLRFTVPVPGGRLMDEELIMRPGLATWGNGGRHFFIDGEQAWLVHGDYAVEIDTETGMTGRSSLPNWLEQQRHNHPDLVIDLRRSQHIPVTTLTSNSPFSTADGYHRHAVFTRPDDHEYCMLVDADGTEYTISGVEALYIQGALSRPGGGKWFLYNKSWNLGVLDSEDLRFTRCHGLEFPTAMWWHHTRVRDEKASTWFRTVTAEELRPLVDKAIAVCTDEVNDELRDAVGEYLDISDTTLRQAIAWNLHTLVTSWPQHDESVSDHSLPNFRALAEHSEVLEPFLRSGRVIIDAKELWQSTSKLGLHDFVAPKESFRFIRHYNWSELLESGDALLTLAALPGRTAEEIQGLKELWTALRDTGVLGATHLTKDVFAYPKDVSWSNITFPEQTIEIDDYRRPDIVLLRADGGGPVTTAKGQTLELLDSRPVSPSRVDLEPVFDALLQDVTANGPSTWSPELGETFAAATGTAPADGHMIMAGFPSFHNRQVNYLSKELRTLMGLKVAEASQVRDRLKPFFEHFLPLFAAGVPEDAATLLTDGPDIGAMADYWLQHGPARAAQLPADIALRKPKQLEEVALQRVLTDEHADDGWANEVTASLWLAGELEQSDALRPALATYIEHLQNSPTGLRDVRVGYVYSGDGDNSVRRAFGLPDRAPDDDTVKTFRSGRFTVSQSMWADRLSVDLESITDPVDPDLKLAREWAVKDEDNLPTLAAVDLRLSGGLASYAEWLGQTAQGDPHDPLAVVPELIADVAATLCVSQDAARYYLQLLALPDPTDANVRRWNGWKKADITAAGAELVRANVVVEGKRPRAGRNFFLPGGWIEAQPPHLPIEQWKTEAFSMAAPGRRSKYEPMLGVAVPPLPPPQWFAACWERSRGDDAPRFDELETTRRRR